MSTSLSIYSIKQHLKTNSQSMKGLKKRKGRNRKSNEDLDQRIKTITNDLDHLKKDFVSSLTFANQINNDRTRNNVNDNTKDKDKTFSIHNNKTKPNIQKIGSSCAVKLNLIVNEPKTNRNYMSLVAKYLSPLKSHRIKKLRAQMQLNTKSTKQKPFYTNLLQFQTDELSSKHIKTQNNQTCSSNEDNKTTQLQSTYHSEIKTQIDINLTHIRSFPICNSIIKSLKILSNSSILTLQERITIVFLNKEISSQSNPYKILTQSYEELIETMKKLQIVAKTSQLLFNAKQLIEIMNAFPSKTAQIALSFIVKENEIQLIDGNDCLSHFLIHLLYVLLQEEENYSSLKGGYRWLFKKYKCRSISKNISMT